MELIINENNEIVSGPTEVTGIFKNGSNEFGLLVRTTKRVYKDRVVYSWDDETSQKIKEYMSK